MRKAKSNKRKLIYLLFSFSAIILFISCNVSRENVKGDYYDYLLKQNFVYHKAIIKDSTIILLIDNFRNCCYTYKKVNDTLYIALCKGDSSLWGNVIPPKFILCKNNFLLIDNPNNNKDKDGYYEINNPILLRKYSLLNDIKYWFNDKFGNKDCVVLINKRSYKRCKIITKIFKRDCIIKVYKFSDRLL